MVGGQCSIDVQLWRVNGASHVTKQDYGSKRKDKFVHTFQPQYTGTGFHADWHPVCKELLPFVFNPVGVSSVMEY